MRALATNQISITHLGAALSLLLSLTLSVNAAAGLFDDEEARKDVKNLRTQAEQQNRDNENRFMKLDESIKNIGVIQLLNQIEQQNAELARLRGQIEVLSNQNEQLVKRQKDFYLDIDTRLRKLEGLPPDSAAVPAAGGALVISPPILGTVAPKPVNTGVAGTIGTGGVSGAVTAAANKEQENKAYDVGSNLFRRGDYVAAIRAFETFMKDYPASPLVSNAQYWIGICYFNIKDFSNARNTQEALVKNFPDAPKAPDALLAIASLQIEGGDNGSARNTLEDIIARYPSTEAATKARTRLDLLRR